MAKADYLRWIGTYSLRVLPKYDQPGAEWDATNNFEPDDVIALANLLNVGPQHAVTRSIYSNENFVADDYDEDHYRFEAAWQQYIIQTFDVQKDASGVGTGLYLLNRAGTMLANDASSSKGAGNIDGEIAFTFTNAGTYFIRVARQVYNKWAGPSSLRVCVESCAIAPLTDQKIIFMPFVQR